MDDTDHYNTTQSSALLNKSKASVSRAAKAGKLGPAYIDPGTKFKKYSISALERYAGRSFTADEIAAARDARGYSGPRQPEIASSFLHRLLGRLIAARDSQWQAALVGQTLVKFTPPPTKGKSP